MITLYGVLLFLHILGAAIWLGGDSAQVGLLLRRIQLGLLVDVIILTAIVFVMATKPSL